MTNFWTANCMSVIVTNYECLFLFAWKFSCSHPCGKDHNPQTCPLLYLLRKECAPKKYKKNSAMWKMMQTFILKQMVSKWGRLNSENKQENEFKGYCNTGGLMKSAGLKCESISKRQ